MANGTKNASKKANASNGGTNRDAKGGGVAGVVGEVIELPQEPGIAGAGEQDGAQAQGAGEQPGLFDGAQAAQTLANAGIDIQPTKRRHRRTTAEIQAAGERSKAKTAPATNRKTELKDSAAGIIQTAELLLISVLGPEAAFQEHERTMLELGLPDTLERITPEVASRVQAIAMPSLLIVGAGAYGLRILNMLQARNKTTGRATKPHSFKPTEPEAPAEPREPQEEPLEPMGNGRPKAGPSSEAAAVVAAPGDFRAEMETRRNGGSPV